MLRISGARGEHTRLAEYLLTRDTRRYIGYIKPERGDLTPVVVIIMEVNNTTEILG